MTTQSLYTLIGYLAATLTTLSFVPQVWKTWHSRSASDLSLTMLMAFSLGVLLWLVYGIAISAMPIVVANTVTLVLSGGLVVMKLTFKK